jgi:hypothetical protein
MDTMLAAYDEVYAYTMGRPGFFLQHVVDAFAYNSSAHSGGSDSGWVVGNAECSNGVRGDENADDLRRIVTSPNGS